MKRVMRRIVYLLVCGGLAAAAVAAPRPITIVNGTDAPLRDVAAKPQNSADWTTLAPGLSPGARTQIMLEPDVCAYDVRGSAVASMLTWRGVNLCETRSVTLNRRGDGAVWVDYD